MDIEHVAFSRAEYYISSGSDRCVTEADFSGFIL
jgi:hypothetical protein